ncbi:hypothetical protein [Salibacterium halotolerans]|nr:hypothetical protein [Salibacterium halotolerans]
MIKADKHKYGYGHTCSFSINIYEIMYKKYIFSYISEGRMVKKGELLLKARTSCANDDKVFYQDVCVLLAAKLITMQAEQTDQVLMKRLLNGRALFPVMQRVPPYQVGWCCW